MGSYLICALALQSSGSCLMIAYQQFFRATAVSFVPRMVRQRFALSKLLNFAVFGRLSFVLSARTAFPRAGILGAVQLI